MGPVRIGIREGRYETNPESIKEGRSFPTELFTILEL